jgi:hypothetical protein
MDEIAPEHIVHQADEDQTHLLISWRLREFGVTKRHEVIGPHGAILSSKRRAVIVEKL